MEMYETRTKDKRDIQNDKNNIDKEHARHHHKNIETHKTTNQSPNKNKKTIVKYQNPKNIRNKIPQNPLYKPIQSTNKTPNHNDYNVKIIHQNIQCLSSKGKVPLLENFLKKEEPQILCLTEHWQLLDTINHIKIKSYKLITHFSRSSKIHGGTAIYVSEKIEDKNIKEIKKGPKNQELDFEWAGIRITENKEITQIFSIYRSPNGNFSNFLDLFNNLLEKNKADINKTVIGGDLNVDHLTNNEKHKQLKDLLDSYELKNTIITATREKAGLDYFITNIEKTEAGVLINHASDHHATYLKCNTNTIKHKKSRKKLITYRNLKDENNHMKMQELLNNTEWDTILNTSENINTKCNKLMEQIMNIYNTAYPKTQKNITPHDKRKEWVTPEIIEKGNRLKKMHYNLQMNNTEDKRKEYNELKKVYRKDIAKQKEIYIENKINKRDNKHRNKAMWDCFNEITGKTKYKEDIEIHINNHTIKDNKELAEIFNDFFIDSVEEKIKNISNKQIAQINTNEEIQNMTNNTEMTLESTTPAEIRKIINKITPNQGTTTWDIPTSILKQHSITISNILSNITNQSFTQGIYPNILNQFEITPKHKYNNKYDINNYRPLYKTSNIGKILQKAYTDRLDEYLMQNNIICHQQHGFRKKHSTTTACYQLITHIISEMDKKNLVMTIFFDLSAAFDVVDNDRLVKKLEKYGINNLPNQWLKSFLENRKVKTKINEHLSIEKHNTNGVSQGTNIGPTLYNTYTNDIVNAITEGEIVMYADDTSITISAKTQSELKEKAEKTIKEYMDWCNLNKMIPNLSKTNYIIYTIRKENIEDINITHNQTIERKYTVKYLGIEIDHKLNWNEQIEKICKKLNQLCYIINYLKKTFNHKSLLTYYYAFGESYLRYGIILWGNTTEHKRIFIIQKRIIRKIYNIHPRTSCKDIFQKNKILTYYALYYIEVTTTIHSQKESIIHNNETHNHNTRQAHHIRQTKTKTTYGQKSPKYQGIKYYNDLPEDLKTLEIKHLKTKLKEKLQTLAPYSFAELDGMWTEEESERMSKTS